MTRTTKTDVTNALARLARAMTDAQISETVAGQRLTGDHLHVQMGSLTYGYPYRLHYRMPDGGGLSSVGSNLSHGFIGTTAREAVMTLDAMTAGIRLAGDARARTHADGLPVDAGEAVAELLNNADAWTPAGDFLNRISEILTARGFTID